MHEAADSSHAARIKTWAIPLALIALTALASFAGEDVYKALRFERAPILAGELWRLVSGNLVHADIRHWLLNMAALLLLWTIYRRDLRPGGSFTIILFSALGTTLGLLVFNPQLSWYVGLSGALHGYLIGASLMALHRETLLHVFLLAVAGIKLLSEQWGGPLTGSDQLISVAVIVDAHLYGALGGALIGFIYWLGVLWRTKVSW